MSSHSVSEQHLDNFALCPLMGPSVNDGRLERVAVRLLTQGISRSCYGALPLIEDLRELFTKLWAEEVSKEDHEYDFGPATARTVAKHAIDFLREFEILEPVTPYELQLGTHTIRGRFALVKKRTRTGYPMVLVMHGTKPPFSPYPDLSSLARVVAVKMNHPEHKRVGIYHLPLVQGESWKVTQIDERRAREWLGAILDSMQIGLYPAPGRHCARCVSHACLEVYNPL